MCVSEPTAILWISEERGTSAAYTDRNFSERAWTVFMMENSTHHSAIQLEHLRGLFRCNDVGIRSSKGRAISGVSKDEDLHDRLCKVQTLPKQSEDRQG